VVGAWVLLLRGEEGEEKEEEEGLVGEGVLGDRSARGSFLGGGGDAIVGWDGEGLGSYTGERRMSWTRLVAGRGAVVPICRVVGCGSRQWQ
jgi:hypothetical protein